MIQAALSWRQFPCQAWAGLRRAGATQVEAASGDDCQPGMPTSLQCRLQQSSILLFMSTCCGCERI